MAKYKPKYARIAQLKTADLFKQYCQEGNINLPFEEELNSTENNVFSEKINLKSGSVIGNRLCVLPMEGWDGTTIGRPTEHTKNRWKKFAISGAKLLFGCEAVAVSHDAKANPNQLVLNEQTLPDFIELRRLIDDIHREKYGKVTDLFVGLQLTHSGRFCKPNSHTKFESQTLYRHPILDHKFHVDPEKQILSDQQIDEIVQKYIDGAVLAQKAGFHFIDIKHCHGYLGHEFLSAVVREGKYGGSFENRTRYFRNIAEGIKKAAPGMQIAMRLSASDFRPFKKGEDESGIPENWPDKKYPFAFGATSDGLAIDLTEAIAFLKMAYQYGVEMVCVTAGSPYYNPHLTRPALFPPSDGYLPPEDPLIGVQRHIEITSLLKKAVPEMLLIGSGYSYLQEWLPNVALSVLKNKMADFVGFGRMILSYPEMPADIVSGKPLVRNLICRTFSDCTTAPRNGLISGCFPLDSYYKSLPEAQKMKELKQKLEE
jgi:2,4-dienoyl-CoA reductase-like NADH-dependent reductase (Old Yellow Enzyme family)